MAPKWPHRPGNLHLGDVFIAKNSHSREEMIVVHWQEVSGGMLVKIEGLKAPVFYAADEPIRILRNRFL
jgi:hypothetical protein